MGGSQLTRGLWYEATRKRWRVRLYRNHTSFHAGYFDTRAEAEAALVELKRKIEQIPKRKRNEKVAGPVPTVGDLVGMLRAAKNG